MEFNHSSYTDRLITLNRLLPLELAAREAECTRQQMVERISRMEVIGVRVNGHWYVERPLTDILFPDPNDYTTAILRLYVCRIGQFLLAGRGELLLPIRSDNSDLHDAITTLDEAEKRSERDLVTITLSGQRFSIDSVLQQELSVTLLYFEIKSLIKNANRCK
jgi:hypothetical protein